MRTLNKKRAKEAFLKIPFPLSHGTLVGRPKYYYCNLLSALVGEQPVLLKETSDTRRHYCFLLFTFFFQILVTPKERGRVVQDGGNCTRKALFSK